MEFEGILDRLEEGKISEQEAIKQMIAMGAHPDLAEECAHIALGGSDCVEIPDEKSDPKR